MLEQLFSTLKARVLDYDANVLSILLQSPFKKEQEAIYTGQACFTMLYFSVASYSDSLDLSTIVKQTKEWLLSDFQSNTLNFSLFRNGLSETLARVVYM